MCISYVVNKPPYSSSGLFPQLKMRYAGETLITLTPSTHHSSLLSHPTYLFLIKEHKDNVLQADRYKYITIQMHQSYVLSAHLPRCAC